ncbi:MAG: glycosyltransferase family 2 protein [Patescibacteria group bacterium]|jgi:glycosyltransferase involved in cell wall biosynthesis
MESKIKYSIVIPAYNEQDAVGPLHQEIKNAMEKIGDPYEIIFIDDGSSDKTFERLNSLMPVKIVKFRKNFGQTAALDAGIKNSLGEVIIMLDADGQNPPSEIPKLLEKMKEGYDVVSGWRSKRKDTSAKKFVSRGANLLRKLLVNDQIHDSGCTLKAYKKECFEDIDLQGEMHRFIPAILRWHGFKVTEVPVEHRARTTGTTKYNWKRILKGFIDMMSVWFWRKYSNRPLHLFGGLGIFIGGTGFALGLFLAIGRLLGLFSLQNRIWPLVAVFLILAGMQLFVSGLLADIAVKSYYSGKRRVYYIEKVISRE